MLGEKADYEVIPYFFSDLSDWASLSYVGHAPGWDRLVLRGALDEGSFSAWYLRDGVVDAALSVGRGEDLPQARRLIDSEQALADPRGLADPDSDLSAIGA
jgi:3-phenylpropionate/trans-cinnamate dioxygenase ferredoxin reductase subunit